ncbi:hypothetical protein FQA39_LY09306 [Lamprigera yunnana]|nr:hypothetical protein FQA39_LY09306 [Lamprigera yunnana]
MDVQLLCPQLGDCNAFMYMWHEDQATRGCERCRKQFGKGIYVPQDWMNVATKSSKRFMMASMQNQELFSLQPLKEHSQGSSKEEEGEEEEEEEDEVKEQEEQKEHNEQEEEKEEDQEE